VYYLIVRSPDNLTETINRFSDKNYQVSGFSVTDIVYISPKMPVITDNHAFIFTSMYGIKSISRFFTPNVNHKAFCIGETTAYHAKNAGFSSVFVPKIHNADGLSELILKGHNNKNLMYCTGVHRKSYLEKNLMDYNLKYHILELYDTVKVNDLPTHIIHLLTYQKNVALVCFSMRNADLLYLLIAKMNTDKSIMNAYQWHIVGRTTEVSSPFQHYQLYDTPQKLYDLFLNP
jgi:uroporphyrinogen-III synthase